MLVTNQQYILWITLLSLLSPCIKSATFKDWLGVSFTASSNNDVWQKAKDSSGWDQSTDVCLYYTTGSSKTNDMQCSNPVPGQNNFEDLWDPSCKIHDVCLKTNGRTASQCDDDFCDNIDRQCGLLAPGLVSGCQTVADLWCTAVSTPCWLGGSCHQGGVDSSRCLTPPKTLTIYCDNSCNIYRTEITSSPCTAANRGPVIASAANWQIPLDVSITGITSTTTICVLATDLGGAAGIMGCVYYNGVKYCTKQGGNWERAGSLSMVRTPYGTGPWAYNFKPSSGVTPEAGAAWWWANGVTHNTMLFRFQFKNIISGAMPVIDDNKPDGKDPFYYYEPPQPQQPKEEPIDNNPPNYKPPQQVPVNVNPIYESPHIEDPSPTASTWRIDLSSWWFTMIGGLLVIMLLFNIICLINYQYKQYNSVKCIDSEFDDTDNDNV